LREYISQVFIYIILFIL